VTGPEDWGEPARHPRSDLEEPIFEPRTFTEASPVPPIVLPEWEQHPDGRWGTTTYVGPRRDRPRAGGPTPQPSGNAPTHHPVDEGERSNRRLLASSRTMAIASLTSRVTGFVRTAMIVAALGIAGVGSSYNAGNNLPNMVYELLLGGVLSSVLVPLLVHAQETDSDEGVAYAQRLLSIGTVALAVMTVLTVLAAPLIAGYFAPPALRHLTTVFAVLLLPEIFFYGLGAMITAVLNIKHVFGPGAWSPVLNNVIVIATVIVFWALPGPATLNPATVTPAQVAVLGVGTTLGIAAQALVLLPFLRRSGFTWKWRLRARPNEVGRMREVGNLAAWVLGYVVVSQIGVSVIQKVGLSIGGFTVFTNVDLLFQMPYGILVVSLLTAIMPRLSRAAVRQETSVVIADLSLGSRLSAIAMVPITAGLMALGAPLCVTLFAYGQTSISDARLVGTALALSAFGLLPFAIVMLQLRVFYAMRDGRAPTFINIFMVALKVTLVLITSALLVPPGSNPYKNPPVHAIEWLNIATSASYVIGVLAGHVILTRRLGRLGFNRVWQTTVRIAIPSAIAGAAAYAVTLVCESALGTGHAGALAGLLGGSIIGLAVLVGLLSRMRIPEITDLIATVRRR
jgi:putative peptidoglycan lipid II flippase